MGLAAHPEAPQARDRLQGDRRQAGLLVRGRFHRPRDCHRRVRLRTFTSEINITERNLKILKPTHFYGHLLNNVPRAQHKATLYDDMSSLAQQATVHTAPLLGARASALSRHSPSSSSSASSGCSMSVPAAFARAVMTLWKLSRFSSISLGFFLMSFGP